MFQLSNVPARFSFMVAIALLLAATAGIQPVAASQTCTTQYYLSPLIGSGTEEDSLRPLIYDMAFRGNGYPYKSVQGLSFVYGPTDPVTGWPTVDWVFVSVSSYNQHIFMNDKRNGVLPALPFSTLVADMDAKTLADLMDVLVQFGIDTSILDTANTYYDVIWLMGQTLNSSLFYIPGGSCPS